MLERLPEFIGNHPILSLIFIGLAIALLATEIGRRFRGFKEVSPSELTRLINQQDAAVIDVGGQSDFEKGHIINSVHVPLTQLDPGAKQIAKLKDGPVAVYCKSGHLSEQAAKKLVKAGFQQVHWLNGGLQAWLNDELPVTRGKR
ncbi:MAG: rhodanese-like domain-containing protein [Xanthomonadales bacterium]|nr:rhodanese-like domain-containing protein [Xanthomonadales bacterium]